MHKDKFGVHITHCCSVHGCKYGDRDCPVYNKDESIKPLPVCDDCKERIVTPRIARGELIEQLKHALHLAESPNEEYVEFDLGDTDFSFDFSEERGTNNEPH